MGVQFVTPSAYSQALVTDVRRLYEADFPGLAENVPFDSTFELFGGSSRIQHPAFKLLERPDHSRYWFISEDKAELVQFQIDRLMHNWRSVDGGPQYPHYESISKKFETELRKLREYFISLEPKSELNILQFEVSYVNVIEFDPGERIDPSVWFNLTESLNFDVEYYNLSFGKVLTADGGAPYARFRVDLKTVHTIKEKPAIMATLLVKGAPSSSTIEACMESLHRGREMIVTNFDMMSTDYAKRVWGKIDG